MSRLILTTEDLWIELRRALAACMKRQELMYEHYDVVLEIDMELLAQWDRIARMCRGEGEIKRFRWGKERSELLFKILQDPWGQYDRQWVYAWIRKCLQESEYFAEMVLWPRYQRVKKILIQQRPRERERIELWAAENMAMGRWVKYDDWRRTAGGAKD